MVFSIFLLFVSLYVRASLGGTLTVVDYNGQCVMWSEDNHGCTGSSAAFGLRDGDDCSDLSKVIKGVRKDFTVLNVDTCGTEDSHPVAWIQVNNDGLVTFFNQGGKKAACKLDRGLKVGSWCNASDLLSISSSSVSSTSTSSDSSSSVSSTSTSSDSSSSVSSTSTSFDSSSSVSSASTSSDSSSSTASTSTQSKPSTVSTVLTGSCTTV
ncbi:uncharacterized protein N7487_000980 [Penicillium crustosum]|uniref:uncharacterized protein n=1 Tax=Penicillium crustosum TaxID=36656 RepID=UPI002392B530|nr:uncharacterized protein N7487_000980 [Penicillium crustosum]KAJ5417430.1 hypothetical protein N7487_000980 [Penicillium crustosum]